MHFLVLFPHANGDVTIFFLQNRPPQKPPFFPYTPLFQSSCPVSCPDALGSLLVAFATPPASCTAVSSLTEEVIVALSFEPVMVTSMSWLGAPFDYIHCPISYTIFSAVRKSASDLFSM